GVDADAPGAAHFFPADEGEEGGQGAEEGGGDAGGVPKDGGGVAVPEGLEEGDVVPAFGREEGDPEAEEEGGDAGVPKEPHELADGFAGHGVGVFAEFAAELEEFEDDPGPVYGECCGGEDGWEAIDHA